MISDIAPIGAPVGGRIMSAMTMEDCLHLSARGGGTGFEDHSGWRRFMAEYIANSMDMKRLGVRSIYLCGSTDSGQAGLGSDIDFIIHFVGDRETRGLLEQWLDGWSVALAAMNYMRTGYRLDKLLDVHIVTDQNIRARDSFATTMFSATESTLLRTA